MCRRKISGASNSGLASTRPLCDLQWHQIELNAGRLHVRRSKKGTPSVHPMQGDEIRALRRLQREQEASPYVFTSERGGPMSAKSFGTLFERLGRRAGMPFTIFPHMLRHACGYALANTTRGRCRHGSGTRISSTRSATPSWRRIGSSISGDKGGPVGREHDATSAQAGAPWGDRAALRDFGPTKRRIGSFTTEADEATPRSMSASPRKRTSRKTFR
jgi:Phage integrase family